MDAYHFLDIEDSGESKLWNGPIFVPAKGTLDQYLLDHWGDGLSTYDAVFFDQWANTQQVFKYSSEVCLKAHHLMIPLIFKFVLNKLGQRIWIVWLDFATSTSFFQDNVGKVESSNTRI